MLDEKRSLEQSLENLESGISQTFFVNSTLFKGYLTSKIKGQKVFVCESMDKALALRRQLEIFGQRCVVFISPPHYLFEKAGNFFESDLIFKTNQIYTQKDLTIIITPEAVGTKFVCKSLFMQNKLLLEKDKKTKIENLVAFLVRAGYEKTSSVSEKGNFSVRGDVVDICLAENAKLFRIIFFGNEIESINELNITNFKIVKSFDTIEILSSKNIFECDKENIKKLAKDMVLESLTPLAKERILQKLQSCFDELDEGVVNGFLLPLMFDASKSLFEILDDDATVLIENPSGIKLKLNEINFENIEEFKSLLGQGEVLNCHKRLFFDHFDGLFERFNQKCVSFQNILSDNPYFKSKEFNKFEVKVVNPFLSAKSILEQIKKLDGYKVFVTTNNQYSLSLISNELEKLGNKNVQFLSGSFDQGIIIDEQNLAILPLKLEGGLIKKSATLSEKFVPKEGDYVVHAFHGIGLCKGIVQRESLGEIKDFVAIEYKGGSMLYVPCENADSISKFSGSGAVQAPQLNVLGGKDFARVKARVKESVKKIAFNLALLYKERMKKKGFVFNKDDELTNAFDNFFPYEETEGQLSALADIKADMESPKIMDRLICGDVGFGKTEVALRAAFKAIVSGKQVAFLAPTTVLSFQHFQNAKARFEHFGVNVKMLNRFVGTKEKKETIEGLESGKVNIVFGTHRLLSDDVKFFDLGLLIVDEEQRFGTAQKEKLKNLKNNIDVLSLSATPIPRTLHLSLINVRDISLIETPPKNRIAPNVYVCEYSMSLVISAIKKELARGGQTIVIFNNIDKIFSFAAEVKSFLGDNVVLDVAHARMSSNILEKKIENLFEGKTQVFISTTIIENGVDLKNANTMIVINSERFGLADLYQLKGRVGRSGNVVSYAYFMHKQGALSPDAEKRLNAISDFTSLGSGYEIAKRDLEIRGSGNIFGAEQSGHLDKVGYVEFAKIVGEVVKEASGENVLEEKNDILLEIKLPCRVDEEMESDTQKRIEIYKNLQKIESFAELDGELFKLKSEYGKVFDGVENLAYIVLLKNMASKCKNKIKKIVISGSVCEIVFEKVGFEITKNLTEVISKNGAVLNLANLPIIYPKQKGSAKENLLETINFVSELNKNV